MSGDRRLRVRGIEKSFGANQVIRPLDLDIPSRQFLAIVGRSGCGKSTLLRLLAGLEAPDAGSVRFDSQTGGGSGQTAGGSGQTAGGSDKAGGSPVRLMFQEPRLLPWASVLENVAVGFGRGKPDDAREKALAALADVGLADRADEWPSVLSGGQKQRVALARALVSHPSVLAFDEPLGALDALTRLEMQALIERVFLAQGFTAIMVTHDVGEAVALADRILVLEAGRIALDVDVPCPRPRRRDDPQAVALEQRVLGRLLEPGPPRRDPRDPRPDTSRSAVPAAQGMPA